MTLPFDESKVLYRFTPSEEEKGPENGLYWDVLEEYVVEEFGTINGCIVVRGWYPRTGWQVNPSNLQTLVAHLLQERDDLLAELDRSKKLLEQAEQALGK